MAPDFSSVDRDREVRNGHRHGLDLRLTPEMLISIESQHQKRGFQLCAGLALQKCSVAREQNEKIVPKTSSKNLVPRWYPEKKPGNLGNIGNY